MRKLILAAIAVSALGTGAVLAQAPNFTGTQPGITNPEYGPVDPYGNSGWTPDRAYSSPGEPSRSVYMLPDGRMVVPQLYANNNYIYRPYASRGRIGDIDGDGIRDRRDSDRDGDGIRNSRDRYPDDWRYR